MSALHFVGVQVLHSDDYDMRNHDQHPLYPMLKQKWQVLPRDLLHDTRMKKTKMACLVGGYLMFAGLSRYV